MSKQSSSTKQRSLTNFILINIIITLLLYFLWGKYGWLNYNLVNFMLIYLIIINLSSFFIFGIDKHLAKKNKNRIPEFTLISTIYLGGTLGAYWGRAFYRHKTLKVSFKKKFWIAVVIQLLFIIAWIYLNYK